MLAHQRQREIVEYLERWGGARVVELARMMSVAEETIRRHLRKLGREGRLVRSHGGAVPLREEQREVPFEVRQIARLVEKHAIAKYAVRYIENGDVIGLDASSTAVELARVLPDVSVTVVTNSVPAAVLLVPRKNVRVISTGGVGDARSLSFTGSLAEASLERFSINKLFFSCKGLDVVRGLSEATDEQARIKRRMLDLAEQRYLLADHNKLGVRSVVFFAALRDVDAVITDGEADERIVGELQALGLRIERTETLRKRRKRRG